MRRAVFASKIAPRLEEVVGAIKRDMDGRGGVVFRQPVQKLGPQFCLDVDYRGNEG